jgi:hypothetical protein
VQPSLALLQYTHPGEIDVPCLCIAVMSQYTACVASPGKVHVPIEASLENGQSAVRHVTYNFKWIDTFWGNAV